MKVVLGKFISCAFGVLDGKMYLSRGRWSIDFARSLYEGYDIMYHGNVIVYAVVDNRLGKKLWRA